MAGAEILPKGSPVETLCRDLVQRSLTEILPRDFLQRSGTETLLRDLLQRSCEEVSYRDLSKRCLLEILNRDLIQRSLVRSCLEISFWDQTMYRDLANIFFYRELVQRSCAEIPTAILPRDFFFWRLCTEILQRRPPLEFLYRDLVLMFCRDLAKRSLTEILCGDH